MKKLTLQALSLRYYLRPLLRSQFSPYLIHYYTAIKNFNYQLTFILAP